MGLYESVSEVSLMAKENRALRESNFAKKHNFWVGEREPLGGNGDKSSVSYSICWVLVVHLVVCLHVDQIATLVSVLGVRLLSILCQEVV